MNYIELQKMRKEAGSFRDGMTMMNPFSHIQWMQDQIKRNGFWRAVTGHGDEGFVDYLGRTGKVNLNNAWTNSQRYNQFMNGWGPSSKAIKSDYCTDLTSKLKALFGVHPLKFGLLRDNKFTKMKPGPGLYAAKIASVKQAAKDDSDIIAPAVAGGGTLLGSILYGRSRGASAASDLAHKALDSHKYRGFNSVGSIVGNKIIPYDQMSDKFYTYISSDWWDGRNHRIKDALTKAVSRGAKKGGRTGLYAGIPLALLVSAMVNSWRSDKQ